MSKPPTKKQEKIIKFINDYYRKYGNSPSFAEIAEDLGVTVGTVQDHLTALSTKGVLSWIPGKARSIKIRRDKKTYNTIPLALVGTISAGEGVTIFEDTDPETINVSSEMITYGYNHYCLRVSGFSMYEDGILEDDIIVVRQQSSASDGDTVVAVINDGSNEKATLKRFYRNGSEIELRPSNQALPSKFYKPEELEIRGKFCGLIRNNL